MISYSKDNTAIYNFLEKAEKLLVDFSIDKVISFDNEDDFCIVIYTAKSRNFILFEAKNYLQEINCLPELINILHEYSNPDIKSSLVELSINHIENQMHSQNNFRFFFDAH